MPSQKRDITIEVPREWGVTKAANLLLWARANRLVNDLRAADSRDAAKLAVKTYLLNLKHSPITFCGLTLTKAVGFAADATRSPAFVASCINEMGA